MIVTNYCHFCLETNQGSYPCPHCAWTPSTEPKTKLLLTPGTVLHGRFVIARVLSHGEFSTVYLAWSIKDEKKVAIKEFLPIGLVDRDKSTNNLIITPEGQKNFYTGLNRFLDEGLTLGKFQKHPNMVSVYCLFKANETGYMVMEYVQGINLGSYIKAKGVLSWRQTISLFSHIMGLMDSLHDWGLLHSAINPGTIILCKNNTVKLLGFATAKHALSNIMRTNAGVNKPGYAAEEQYLGNVPEGTWTDIYAIAACIYFCLTGQAPPDSLGIKYADQLVKPSLLNVQIPEFAESALLEGLSVNANLRPKSVSHFYAALIGKSPNTPSQPADLISAGQAADTLVDDSDSQTDVELAVGASFPQEAAQDTGLQQESKALVDDTGSGDSPDQDQAKITQSNTAHELEAELAVDLGQKNKILVDHPTAEAHQTEQNQTEISESDVELEFDDDTDTHASLEQEYNTLLETAEMREDSKTEDADDNVEQTAELKSVGIIKKLLDKITHQPDTNQRLYEPGTEQGVTAVTEDEIQPPESALALKVLSGILFVCFVTASVVVTKNSAKIKATDSENTAQMNEQTEKLYKHALLLKKQGRDDLARPILIHLANHNHPQAEAKLEAEAKQVDAQKSQLQTTNVQIEHTAQPNSTKAIAPVTPIALVSESKSAPVIKGVEPVVDKLSTNVPPVIDISDNSVKVYGLAYNDFQAISVFKQIEKAFVHEDGGSLSTGSTPKPKELFTQLELDLAIQNNNLLDSDQLSLGIPEVQSILGAMYDSGYGVSQDYYQAEYWYKKAAGQGNPAAISYLANLYRRNKVN